MRKVLVTGAGGFIGSHLAELCVERGFNVRAFVHYNSMGQRGWLEKSPLAQDMEIVAGDIRDYDSVLGAVKNCDTVFHLAALIGIPYSYISPLAYVRTNVEGTYNVLQACRESGAENILVTSTSETYGTAQYVPMDENHRLAGQSPYSASKIGADQIALSYYCSFNSPVKVVRPFNTYGPRQSARAIIPTIILQLLNGKTKLRLGNTSPTRDLTFVADVVRGFLAIAQSKDLIGEVTNIGSNQEIAVGELAQLIASLMGQTIEVIKDHDRSRPLHSEVERLKCDNSKIKAKTLWEPQQNLRTGLEATIQWIREHQDKYKPEEYAV